MKKKKFKVNQINWWKLQLNLMKQLNSCKKKSTFLIIQSKKLYSKNLSGKSRIK